MKQFRFNISVLAFILMCSTIYAQDYDIDLSMDAGQQVPSNGSTALGFDAGVGYSGTYFNSSTKELFVSFTFSGLTAVTTASHIHGPALPGVNNGVLIPLTSFPTGVTAGAYSNSFVLSSTDSSRLMTGNLYINIHTSIFPGGEIRGQLIPSALLPVELISFSAITKGRGVELTWKTATEINNYGFEIERSTTPVSPPLQGGDVRGGWSMVGFVEGNGTTNAPKEYSFLDKNITAGKFIYRLKQIDRDGQFEYSHEVEVVISQIPQEFSLMQNYPNPFNPTTTISYQLSANSYTTLRVYDMLGKEVATLVNEAKEAGSYTAQFDGSKLSNGMYFYTLQAGNFTATKKLTLMK
ncbi:MAG: CHRD domain-containing protein [Bacteroidota bacterium]|nr:CHRD domain-containing protein [Bacteroidota bacterium]